MNSLVDFEDDEGGVLVVACGEKAGAVVGVVEVFVLATRTENELPFVVVAAAGEQEGPTNA